MKYFILIGQLSGLVLTPYLLYSGSFYEIFIAICVFALGSCFGGTMTYHRLLAHRSWKCPKWLEYTFVLIETIMITGSAIAWVAIHREHHKHSDSHNDPHSPVYKGLLRMHFLSMMVKPKAKYATDLIRDPFYQFQHKYYIYINLAYAAFLFLIDPLAIIYAWLVPAALVWQANSMIISFSHKNGIPTNNFLLGLITFGEGWHKNHHDNWKKIRLHRWDIGGYFIEKIQRWTHG